MFSKCMARGIVRVPTTVTPFKDFLMASHIYARVCIDKRWGALIAECQCVPTVPTRPNDPGPYEILSIF